jgi:hypothetical protein
MPGRRPKCGTLSAVGYVSAALSGILCASDPAFAYRPFDGTDAAVAEAGHLEIELGPVEYRQQGSERFLIAPDLVLNFGLTKELEAVFEGRLFTPLSPSEPPVLMDAGIFIKYLLLAGVLQDKSGPSVATEFGVLLPDTADDSNFGANWAVIVSQRWDWVTAHFNVQTQLNREGRADLFVSTIVEGPHTWKVRPVAEVFYEDDVGSAQTVSGLIGAIWQVRDDLAFDVAARHARVDGQPVTELRAGLTFSFPYKGAAPGVKK